MDTRTRILETALRMFLVHGYEQTSMRELAQELRLTKPAIYHYFAGKEALALAVVQLFEERILDWVKQRRRAVRDFDSYLRFMCEAIPAFSHVERVVLRDELPQGYRHGFNEFVSSLAGVNPDVRQRMAEMFQRTRASLRGICAEAMEQGQLRGDVDVEALSFLLHATVEGMGVLTHFEPGLDEETISNKLYTALHTILKPVGGER